MNFHRSLSVNVAEDESEGTRKPSRSSVASPIGLSERNNRVPRSLRYMRNKPTIISLKTPSYEYGEGPVAHSQQQSSGDKDRLAEEGKTNGGDTSDVFDNEVNELHPIMGSTRPGQGSLAVGRPLEVQIFIYKNM